MSSKEQKVALIVKSDHLSSAELGNGGEEGAEQPSHRVSEESGEIIQDKFGWLVFVSGHFSSSRTSMSHENVVMTARAPVEAVEFIPI